MNGLRLFCCCQSLIDDALHRMDEKNLDEVVTPNDKDESFNTKTQGDYPARKETVVSAGSKLEGDQSSL